jgi:hypothetical protein
MAILTQNTAIYDCINPIFWPRFWPILTILTDHISAKKRSKIDENCSKFLSNKTRFGQCAPTVIAFGSALSTYVCTPYGAEASFHSKSSPPPGMNFCPQGRLWPLGEKLSPRVEHSPLRSFLGLTHSFWRMEGRTEDLHPLGANFTPRGQRSPLRANLSFLGKSEKIENCPLAIYF